MVDQHKECNVHLFMVKFQKGLIDPKKPDKGWKADEPYPVFDVWKYSKLDKETGIYVTVTKLLICNPSTGEMRWAEAKGLVYTGE